MKKNSIPLVTEARYYTSIYATEMYVLILCKQRFGIKIIGHTFYFKDGSTYFHAEMGLLRRIVWRIKQMRQHASIFIEI